MVATSQTGQAGSGCATEELHLEHGDIYAVLPGRPHRVSNGGDSSATFLVIQDGDYDYVPQG